MEDWSSYDAIAHRYDAVWAERFEFVARHIWTRVPVVPGQRILDVGSGTGIVLRSLGEARAGGVVMVACDRSSGMLRRAAVNVAGAHVVAADALALPLSSHSFDVATASFVLSHISDYPAAVRELRRVLKRGGVVAVTNWSPVNDDYTAAWSECLERAISKSDAQRATKAVAPCEDELGQAGALERVLTTAGFTHPSVETVRLDLASTVDQFLDDRELSSGGRLAKDRLDPVAWARFRSAAAESLRARFGESFTYRRIARVATATR